MDSKLLTYPDILEYFGVNSHNLTMHRQVQFVSLLSGVARNLVALITKKPTEQLIAHFEHGFQVDNMKSKQLLDSIQARIESSPKLLPKIEDYHISTSSERKQEELGKGGKEGDEESSSSESSSEDSSSFFSSLMKPGKRSSGFVDNPNPYCSLTNPYLCRWNGYGTMRLVKQELKKGCYQIVFTFKESGSSARWIAGVAKNWTRFSSDDTFGYNPDSVAFLNDGSVRVNNKITSGGKSWTSDSDNLYRVALELDLRKAKHSKLLCFVNRTRQPLYIVGVPSPCQFGASGGRPGCEVAIIKFKKISKVHFKKASGDMPLTWNA